MTSTIPIKPLFILTDNLGQMGQAITKFTHGTKLIDAKNDSEAISTFLNEFKDSPETLRSYSKEIEHLLLWCIHIGKINIASLCRNHLLQYSTAVGSIKSKDLTPFD